jgi:hypothetical protein
MAAVMVVVGTAGVPLPTLGVEETSTGTEAGEELPTAGTDGVTIAVAGVVTTGMPGTAG